MRQRTRKDFEATNARLLDTQAFMAYVSLGRNSALRLGEVIGAKRKIGSRTLYDRAVIDRYLDAQAEEVE